MSRQTNGAIELAVLERARRLGQLERDFLRFLDTCKRPETLEEMRAFVKEAFRISREAFETKNEIMERLGDVANLSIQDQKVIQILDKVRRNGKFYSVSFYVSQLRDVSTDNREAVVGEFDAFVETHLWPKFDDLYSDFTGWFDVVQYNTAKIKIGCLIASSIVPDNLRSYFAELREVFAFGQYRASIALSRAVLEMSLFDRLRRKKAFESNDPKVTSINAPKEDNLYMYINLAKWKKVLSADEVDLAHRIRSFANSILHVRDKETKPSEKETLDLILKTTRVVERLYR